MTVPSNFNNKVSSMVFSSTIDKMVSLTNFNQADIARLTRIKTAWNFYEGYHWEGMPQADKPAITINYVRAFVNKFVSFELGEGFYLNTNDEDEKTEEGEEKEKVTVTTYGKPKTLYEFLEDIWIENKRSIFCVTLGQTKSITGDAWVKVTFTPPEELDDPFEEFPKGKILINVVPTQYVFPTYDDHDIDKVIKVEIKYMVTTEKRNLIGQSKQTDRLYTEVWTKDTVKYYLDKEELTDESAENPYGVLPFVQIKNFVLAGQESGVSDIEDLIPLNVEYNSKKSDVSEIIDYHAAPITVVYGARIGNLEKGANKIWGGLPKDAKISNLELGGDLLASSSYIKGLKSDMCEVAGIPETVLGGSQAISNTSGIALQYMNLPLIDRTKVKRALTKAGIEKINKLVIKIGLVEELIVKPPNVDNVDFYYTEVILKDTLPKDHLLELQEIKAEMDMAIEDREGAMERLGRDNISEKIKKIDADRKNNPTVYGIQDPNTPQLNSGFTNGETPQEAVNVALNGVNAEMI